MTSKISALVASTTLALLCTVSVAAFADGMPFKETKPQPNLTPMDKMLGENLNKQPPVSVTPPAQTQAAAPAPAVAAAPAPTPAPAAPAPAPAPAEAAPVPESRVVDVQPNTSFFGLSVGMYDPITHNKKAGSFNLEWQPGVKIVGYLQPLFGAMATTNGAVLGYGGIGVPFNVTDHIFVMPSLAVGAYKKGGGYDLERTVVYRGGAEFAYEFDDKSRLGLNLHVITNGKSPDRKDRTEVAAITYTVPLDIFSKPAADVPAASATPLVVPSSSTSTTAKPLPNVLP